MRSRVRRDVLTATFNFYCSYVTAAAVIYSQAEEAVLVPHDTVTPDHS